MYDRHDDETTPPLFDLPTASTNASGPNSADRDGAGWLADGLDAIDRAVRDGHPFQAHDLTARFDLREPDRPHKWGTLLAAAHRAGVIRAVAAVPSARRTVKGLLCKLWAGVEPWAPPAAEPPTDRPAV